MSLDTLNQRLTYKGGGDQEKRFQKDKLYSLRKALLYSYQAATAILPDSREFRCLINDNKLTTDYDEKILSIPYRDICLNEEQSSTTLDGLTNTNVEVGQVFEWKETSTYWLIYNQYLEEDAYFRADIIRCNAEAEMDNDYYWIYMRGPTETELVWNQKNSIVWNDINYSFIIYITKNEETLDYFHRFTKIKIDGKNWEVKVVNPWYGDGIIKVCLGEWYNNEMEDVQIEQTEDDIDTSNIYIDGTQFVQPYDIINYTIQNNEEEGSWEVSSIAAKIISSNSSIVSLEILSSKSGEFDLNYLINDEIVATLHITINSL